MSSEVVRQILEDKLKAFWLPKTNIEWENVKFSPAVGITFISCQIEETFSEPIAFKCQREIHLMTIEVNTQANTGTTENKTICDDLVAEYFGFSVGNLSVLNGRAERKGNTKEWHKRNVLIEVQYDNHF